MIIRDAQCWHRWEAEWQRRTPADPETNFRIYGRLHEPGKASHGEHRDINLRALCVSV